MNHNPRRHEAIAVKLRTLLLLFSSQALLSCGGPQNYLEGASPAARSIAQFGWTVLAVFCVMTLAIWLLLVWIALRRRGSLAEHAPIELSDGISWIVVGGLVIPASAFAAVFALMMRPMHAGTPHAPGTRAQVRVTGQQWWFDAQYVFDEPSLNVDSPTELHIPVGAPVEVELASQDVIHSFWVPKLGGKVDLIPGETNHLRLEADRPGVYAGECAEFCGVQHAHMRIEVVAQSPREFASWLEAQRQPALMPSDPEAARGQDVFLNNACPLCHTIRGTASQGKIGPDLTHVGSRRRIAGGMLENNAANLAAWVIEAQAIKPGSQMPTLRGLNGADLRSLIAYLQSLR
jgi:cytochrome c oxidase subunit 2